MRRRRSITALVCPPLIMTCLASPVVATHTAGTLNCGSAGTYEVEASSIEPLPKFETPVPWSGLFPLEGTTRVFRALSIQTPRWSIILPAADRNPRATITCTLASNGFNFEQPWRLEGFLTP